MAEVIATGETGTVQEQRHRQLARGSYLVGIAGAIFTLVSLANLSGGAPVLLCALFGIGLVAIVLVARRVSAGWCHVQGLDPSRKALVWIVGGAGVVAFWWLLISWQIAWRFTRAFYDGK